MESGKRKVSDKIYDILSVELIAVVLLIIAGLVIKLIGGEFYTKVSGIYHLHVDTAVSTDVFEGDVEEFSGNSSNDELTESVAAVSEIPQVIESTVSLIEQSNKKSSNILIWPIQGKVTSNFGKREISLSGASAYHEGIDISGNEGTPIKAAADGTVYYVGESEGYGKYIIINHGNSFTTLYAHCSSIYKKVGNIVSKGDTVAAVGSTGRATGSHLHFEVRVNNCLVNPIWVLSDNTSL